MGDGHLGKCKDCAKKDVNERYYKEFLKIREYESKRFKNPDRKKKIKLYAKNRNVKFPEKALARTKLYNAVRSGKLIRLPCEVCGDPKSQGHHHDYSKPLDVKWLCFKHHRLEHGQTNVVL